MTKSKLDDLPLVRSALLDFFAETTVFEFDPDADTDSSGRTVDRSYVRAAWKVNTFIELLQRVGFDYHPERSDLDPVEWLTKEMN